MPDGEQNEQEQKQRNSDPPPGDQIVQTQHTLSIDGRELRYTVTTGTLILKEEAEKKGEQEGEAEGEKARASFFFVAYMLDALVGKSRIT